MAGPERAVRGAQTGWAGWVFSSWTGRGLLALLAIICILSFAVLREDNRIKEAASGIVASQRLSVLSEVAGNSVGRLARHMSCGPVREGGDAGLRIGEARAALEEMRALPHYRLRKDVDPLLNLLDEAETNLSSGEDLLRLVAALDYQLGVLKETVREKEVARLSERGREVEDAIASRTQLITSAVMVAFLAFLLPAWMAWAGKEKLRQQIEDLADGRYGKPAAVEKWVEHGDLLKAMNGVSRSLAEGERERLETKSRQEKILRQLHLSLEAMARGNYTRLFQPDGDEGWMRAAKALNAHMEALKEAREKLLRQEEGRKDTIAVPKDSFFLLERLLADKGRGLEKVVKEFPPESPLRGFAVELAELVGGQREVLSSIEERIGGIMEISNAVVNSVVERENDLEREYEFIHETSSTVDEVSVAAKQSSQMVEHVFEASQKAMDTAEEGRGLVNQSIEGMNLIADQVNTIAHNILGLSKKSQEIGNIVRVVGEVSKQTNLLALNAAIEAAGAGEHGKGFAVVAKEIRGLAVKSSRSTQDIEKLIQEMQDATNTAVMSAEEGSKSVQAGVRVINSLNASFGHILEGFQEVVESAQQISIASREQTTGARQVAASIGSIDKMMLTSLRELQKLKEHLENYRRLAQDFERFVSGRPGKP